MSVSSASPYRPEENQEKRDERQWHTEHAGKGRNIVRQGIIELVAEGAR